MLASLFIFLPTPENVLLFAPTFTYRQLYDLYHEGFHPTRRLIEDLLATLADWEHTLDVRRRQAVEGLAATVRRLQTQLARTKEKLVRKECEVYALTRRVQELQAELARRDSEQSREALAASLGIPPPVRRDSHNSSLPPSSDQPGAKAKNAAVRRTRSLRRKSGRRPGGQPGHKGATLRQVQHPDRLRVHEPYHCRGCGASLDDCAVVGRRRRQVFDLPQPAVEVTEHWAQTKRCDRCGARTRGPLPERRASARAIWGAGALGGDLPAQVSTAAVRARGRSDERLIRPRDLAGHHLGRRVGARRRCWSAPRSRSRPASGGRR